MAKRFLTNIDLSGNQLLNATFEKLAEDPTTGNFEGRMYYNTADDLIRVYDGAQWLPVGSVTDIQGTTNQIEVSASTGSVTLSLAPTIDVDTTGNAGTATALETARTISFGGDLSGSALFDGTQDVTINGFINTDSAVDSITNNDGNLVVSASVGAVQIDLASSITADVTGDLTGNADTATYATTAGTANAVAADSVALGTDTTGDYVESISGDTEIVVTGGTGEGSTPTLSLGPIISSDTTGNAATATYATTAGGVDPNSVALGTDTTGDYVADITAGTGISVTGTGEGASVVVTNEGVVDISGTTNEIEVSASVGSVTVGLPSDVIIGNNLTVSNDLIVDGNLTVSGSVTTVNTETILLADNIITLNSNLAASATPTEDAGIEVNRGSESSVLLRWNETSDSWEATTDGILYKTVLLTGDATSADIVDFEEAAQDVVGAILGTTDTVALTYTDGTPEITADVVLQSSDSYLLTASGLAVDIATLQAQLVTDSFTKKAAANVGNGVNTSFAISHNLGTRDVQVQVYDNATYDTVEVDVVRTNTNTVTVSFTTAPTSNAYRVVVIG